MHNRHQLTGRPPPVQGLKRKIHNIYELICHKNTRLAQTELTKLIKKQKVDLAALKALQLWLNIMNQKTMTAIKDLENFLETLRNVEEDDQLTLILASAFKFLGRCDKSAEGFAIYAERFDRPVYIEQCYEHFLRDLNFDELSKFAMRLVKADPLFINKRRLCVASFLQATFKKTVKERLMGFKFAMMLAKKVFSESGDKLFLDEFMSAIEFFMIEPVTIARKHFLMDKDSKTVVTRLKQPVGIEAAQQALLKVPFYDAVPIESSQSLEEQKQIQKQRIDVLKNNINDRNWNDWENAIQGALELQSEFSDSIAFKELADVFQEKIEKRELFQDELLACIRFLESTNNNEYFLGTLCNRIIDYVEKYGYSSDIIHYIVDPYQKLNLEEQNLVIERNSVFVTKYREILHSWFEQKASKPNDVFTVPGESDEEWITMLSQMDDSDVNKSRIKHCGFLIYFYYQRELLSELLEIKRSEKRRYAFDEIWKRITYWIKTLYFLEKSTIPELVNIDPLCTSVIRLCAGYFWWFYENLQDYKYLEMLACFLINYQRRHSSKNQVIHLLLVHTYCELGLAESVEQIFEEMELRHLQFQSMGYISDYFLDNIGRFDDSQKFYDVMNRRYTTYFLEMQDNLVMSCFDTRLHQALQLAIKIAEMKNSLQKAVHYNRKLYLDLILRIKTMADLKNAFMRDGWPYENSYDHRDIQIHLQNLAVQQTSYCGYFQAKTYCENVCEIHTLHILMEFIVVIGLEYKNPKFRSRLFDLNEALNMHRQFSNVSMSKTDPPVCTKVGFLRCPIVSLFLDLIQYSVGQITSLVDSEPKIEEAVEHLPSVEYLQQIFDQIELILLNLFKKNNNYGVRLQYLASTLKMSQYFSQFVVAQLNATASVLNLTSDQLKTTKKYEPVFNHFRRCAVEIRILLTFVESISKKFSKQINVLEKFKDSLEVSNAYQEKPITYTVNRYLNGMVPDLKNSLQAQKKCFSLDVLVKSGLLTT